jgi:hypothetical protein
MFGRGAFLKSKNFDSMVIVVPLHVSKSYRVLKELTAYLTVIHFSKSYTDHTKSMFSLASLTADRNGRLPGPEEFKLLPRRN